MDILVPHRSARHIRRARIAYSPTCAQWRMTTIIPHVVSSVIPGFNQSKNGTMNRDVFATDSTFVEPIKVTTSQPNTGNQYFNRDFIPEISTETPNIQHRTLNVQ